MACDTQCAQFDWVALSAMIIAGCALGVSIWQGYLSRKHSELSLRPLLEIYTTSAISADFGAKLTNVGTGPAIIRHVVVEYFGKRYDAADQSSFEELIIAWESNGLPKCNFFATQSDGNGALGVGGSFFVFQITESEDMQGASKFFRQAFHHMNIEAKYDGWYGAQYATRHAGKLYSRA